MNKHSTDENPTQQSLMVFSVLDELDNRVRRTTINGETYVSAYDILQHYGNKKNPTQSWRVSMEYMVRQGYSTPSVVYQFEGKDGKRKAATPVINLETFMRFVQSAEVPEWEPIREWLAKLGAEELKSKAQKQRESSIALLQKQGLGNHPETLRKIAHNEALIEWDNLRRIYARLDKPDWAAFVDTEYFALFGMFSKQLKKVLGNESIRSALDTLQLETMAYAEKRLQFALTQMKNPSNEQVMGIIKIVVEPLGIYLKGYAELLGIDRVTGKPMLPSGK